MAAIAGSLLASVATEALSKALGLGAGGYIEQNGTYELHKGEIVIPAAQAKVGRALEAIAKNRAAPEPCRGQPKPFKVAAKL